MIDVYSRDNCGSCIRVKTELKTRGIPFREILLDKDITKEDFIEKFPGKTVLPVIVAESKIFSGPNEILSMLSEYKENFGKDLLNESIGRFVNEGGYDNG
jgi:glutaredoxin